MKKQFFSLLALLLVIAGPVFGQDITRTTSIQNDPISLEEVLERISDRAIATASEVIVDSFTIREPLPLSGNTKQDSLNIQYNEFSVVNRSIRIKPDVMSVAFPEVVNYDRENNPIVDHNSLISYLLIAMNKQQLEIVELKRRLSEIESQ